MKIHISQIDKFCKELGVSRIPSNYNDDTVREQEYYEELEMFIVERKDGTPMGTCYREMKLALLSE